MASVADIETALVNAVTAVFNPAAGQTFAQNVSIARGWPTQADLRAATSAPTNLIGIYALGETAKDITTSLRQWQELSPGTGALEVGRIEQVFRLDIWAASPASRDELLNIISPALKFQRRYALGDGSVATMMKMVTLAPDDKTARANEWAQSLDITMQYSVIYTQAQSIVSSLPSVDVTMISFNE